MSDDWTQEIDELYTSYVREIFAYCVRRLACRDLAEEATSSVFLRLVKQYAELRARSRQKLRAWLYGTASNVVAAMLVDARHRQEIARELARQRLKLAEAEGHSRMDWPLLYEAISQLKERQQSIIVLRFFHGMETAEIAEALGMRHVTVRVQISRTVQQLRRKLENAFGELPEIP